MFECDDTAPTIPASHGVSPDPAKRTTKLLVALFPQKLQSDIPNRFSFNLSKHALHHL